jgi:hypothetical protein
MMAQDMETLLSQWAKYLLDSYRRDESPGDDKTGKLQEKKQTNQDVWFLPGSFGNEDIIARKNVKIPAGRKLFCVAASADVSTREPPYNESTPPGKLRQDAEDILNGFTEAYVEIDGQRYSKDDGLKKVVTQLFPIEFADGNPYAEKYRVSAGSAKMVCAALVAYVEPLSQGPHKITVYCRRGDDNFKVNVTYDVTVIPPT